VPVLVMASMVVAALLAMPILLRLFLGLRPLPPGPLRERLESTAQRLRFRYSNILVWHTRNLFANAMVTGFVPWIRYIVLTDRLIDDLTPDEIEAVFGHEVGHIKHHHLLFYLAFFVTSVLVLGLLWELAAGWFSQSGIAAALASTFPDTDFEESLQVLSGFAKLGTLAVYMLVCFGYLSRRCERQADLFGAQTVSTDVFVSALEKVADINGMPRNRFSWLHPSIDKRIDFLLEMRDHPARVPWFHFSIRLMQWALYLSLGELIVLLWAFDLLDVGKLLL
jgi:STE24 endopeptidase